jgi:hypothetical protein
MIPAALEFVGPHHPPAGLKGSRPKHNDNATYARKSSADGLKLGDNRSERSEIGAGRRITRPGASRPCRGRMT